MFKFRQCAVFLTGVFLAVNVAVAETKSTIAIIGTGDTGESVAAARECPGTR